MKKYEKLLPISFCRMQISPTLTARACSLSGFHYNKLAHFAIQAVPAGRRTVYNAPFQLLKNPKTMNPKIALVTGGSRGLGRDMAHNLAQKGLRRSAHLPHQ